jgi:hypothetical protein
MGHLQSFKSSVYIKVSGQTHIVLSIPSYILGGQTQLNYKFSSVNKSRLPGHLHPSD